MIVKTSFCCSSWVLCTWLLARATPERSVDVGEGSCSTTGPATLQQRTARVGGTPMVQLSQVVDAAACAKSCCDQYPCRAWTWSTGTCQLLQGYAAPQVNASATSGVVYRAAFQAGPWGGLRGFNYVPSKAVNDIDMWRDYDPAAVERDMGIAQRAGFNFARVFLNFHVWDAQREVFIANLRHFLSTAKAHGVDVMPIAFDLCWFGCQSEKVSVNSSGKCWYPSPEYDLADDKDWWVQHGEKYIDALVEAFPTGTPGLLLWDVTNEPESGGQSHLPGESGVRWSFVRHFVRYFRAKSSTPTTVGVAAVQNLAKVGDVVDVLSFHSYHASWEQGLERTEEALGFARRYKKPVFNSETGCIARANAFDQTIEMCARNGMGFAVWELMISDCVDCVATRRWKHGLMYADGTTRDPAAIAALHGVYINRGDDVDVAVPRADVEGVSSRTADSISKWMAAGDTANFNAGVELLDTLSNLMESSLVVPLVIAPSAVARQLAAAGESPESRHRLQEQLKSLVGPLQATKQGKETAPGVCAFDSKVQDLKPPEIYT